MITMHDRYWDCQDDGDLRKQVSDDTCKDHGVFCCEQCFEMYEYTSETADYVSDRMVEIICARADRMIATAIEIANLPETGADDAR